MSTTPGDQQALETEIAELEKRLQDAKSRLNQGVAFEACLAPANDGGAFPLDFAIHALITP